MGIKLNIQKVITYIMEIESTDQKPGQLGQYNVLRDLGTGFTSDIKLGYDPEKESYVALKILKDSMGLRKDKTIKSEVDSLSNLSHPNIIAIYDVQENSEWVMRDGSCKTVTFISLELAEGGELFDYVANTGVFSEGVARYYFR